MNNNKMKPGIVKCRACRAEWSYAQKYRVLEAVSQKCTCHRRQQRNWEKRPFSLAGWWQDALVFDHANGAGVDECRELLKVRAIDRLRKRKAAQARYRKGLATSFSPSGATDVLAASHGVLIKHQDGSPPTSGTVEYVAGAIELLADTVAFLGIDLPPLREFFTPRLVVSHTQGKHPFLTDFGGIFRTNDGQDWSPSISVGCRFVDSGIHELAHAIDAYAGFLRNGEWSHRGWTSASIPWQTLKQMTGSCNSENLDQLLKRKSYDTLTDEDVSAARVAKIRGRYWRRPQEQFARAIEQLASAFAQLENRQRIVGVHAYDCLRKEKGQWDMDADEAIDFLGPIILNAFNASMKLEGEAALGERAVAVNSAGR